MKEDACRNSKRVSDGNFQDVPGRSSHETEFTIFADVDMKIHRGLRMQMLLHVQIAQ